MSRQLTDERMGSPRRGVVVANPSSNAEMTQAAMALGGTGLLSRYQVPLATSARHEELARRVLPDRLAGKVIRELRRRRLPPGVPESAFASTAAISDLRKVALSRLPLPQRAIATIGNRHRERFDALVAGSLKPEDAAVLALPHASVRSVRRANELGIGAVIDCQSGHPRFVREFLREEAALAPQWAGTLQGHDISDHAIAEYDDVMRRADLLLVVSSHARATLLAQGADESKMVMTPLGVDLDLFSPGPPRDDDVFRIIFVGRISQAKGIGYLIDGFRQAQIPNSELLLVGAPVGDRRGWHNLPGVEHSPPVPRTVLPDHYRRADVYVLPSLTEGFPLTAMEAMACGLPVILSEHTFGRDVVTDGVEGYVVPTRSAGAIAERLRVLAADPDQRRVMGEAARARAMCFSWARYGEQIVKVLSPYVSAGGAAEAGARVATA